MIVLLSLLLVILSFILINYYKILVYWRNKGIKYVRPLPIFGNSLPLALHWVGLQEFIVNVYNKYPNERYCGTFQYGQPILVVRDPALIKTIFIKAFNAFADHAISANAEDDSLWGKNLFASSGDNWKNLRQTISPFFTMNKMKNMFLLVEGRVHQVMDYLNKDEKVIVELELSDILKRYSADVIASIAFGIDCNSLIERDNEFIQMGIELTNFSGLQRFKRLLYSLNPTIRKMLNLKMHPDKVANFFRALVKTTIENRHKKNATRPDYIQHLLETRKGSLQIESSAEVADTEFSLTKESNLGPRSFISKLTDEDITAQALDFFYGGFYSTSSLIVFCLYELAVNPNIQKMLRQEVGVTLSENGGKITYESLIHMRYLDMVISETLRKWPTATWIDRKSTKDIVIAPETKTERRLLLEAGSLCWIPVFAIHRDSNYWPEPEKFNPERFSEGNRSKIHNFTFLPFGAGPRNCIGSRFAIMVAKLAIFYILSKYEVLPSDKSPSASLFMTSSTSFWLTFKKKEISELQK